MSARILLASGNRHKLRELEAMLAEANVAVETLTPTALGVPPAIEESGATFADNAAIKARAIAAWARSLGEPDDTLVVADDSGVSVDALGGRPGVHSARFAGPDADDEANNRALVQELIQLGLDWSPGNYTCVLAVCRLDATDITFFHGNWNVEVRRDRRGSGGFGYDPHCWIDGGRRTVAELDPAEKAGRSHRGRAMAALLAWLRRVLPQKPPSDILPPHGA